MKISELYRPEHITVADLLYINRGKFPGKEAVVFEDKRYTYRDIDEESNRIANYIIGLGIKKETKIALMMLNSMRFISVYFGIVKAGCVVVPVNIKFTYRETAFILQNSEAQAIFISEEFRTIGSEITENLEKIKVIGVGKNFKTGLFLNDDELSQISVKKPEVIISENDLCSIIYTSGTTGTPRGAVFTHRKIIYNAYVIGAVNHGYNFESRSLIVMPMTHSAPMNNHVLGTISAGGTLVIQDKFEPGSFLNIIEKEKITHFFGPALVYLACTKNCDMSKYNLSSVKMFIVGGSPIGETSLAEVIEKFQLQGRLMQVYGLTEAGPAGCAILPGDMMRKTASIGIGGCIGAEIKLVDEDNEVIVEPEVVGQIAVYSESNMLEYYKDEKKTKETLVNGWVLTGDLGKYDKDGYIYFVDRLKDIIISGGQNVYSKEVESVLLENSKIQEAAVIGAAHPIWGESVKAVVVAVTGQTVTVEEVKEFCQGKLAPFKCPRYVQIVSELPHNASGKIVKPLVRELYGTLTDSASFEIDLKRCSMCGLCVDVCPFDAVDQRGRFKIDQNKCKACGICVKSCPSNAIIRKQ